MEEDDEGVLRPEALADMSKYYIEPTPALKNMIEIIKKFFDDGTSKDEPLDLLVSFSKVCTKILDSDFKGKYQRFGTVGMLCRIMVATTLLYDHLHYQGVFVKDSPHLWTFHSAEYQSWIASSSFSVQPLPPGYPRLVLC